MFKHMPNSIYVCRFLCARLGEKQLKPGKYVLVSALCIHHSCMYANPVVAHLAWYAARSATLTCACVFNLNTHTHVIYTAYSTYMSAYFCVTAMSCHIHLYAPQPVWSQACVYVLTWQLLRRLLAGSSRR